MIDPYAILGSIGVAIGALIWAFFGGRKSGKNAVKLDQAKAEISAHERLNNAEAGTDNDDANVKRLRDLADKLTKHGGR